MNSLAYMLGSQGISELGGWQEHLVPLSLSGVYRGDLAGHAVVYCRDGSTPGAVLQFDFGGGGLLTAVRPGQHFVGRFTTLQISLGATNLVTAGVARLLVMRTPNVDYRELPQADGSGTPRELATTALYNSALNVPATAAEGLALEGAKGARVLVSTSDAIKTVTGGSVKLWYYSLTDAAWFESESEFQLVTGRARVCTPDVDILAPYGRLFAEVRNFTDSGGSGSADVRLQVWGA